MGWLAASADMTTRYFGLEEESAGRSLTAFGGAMHHHVQVDGMEAKS